MPQVVELPGNIEVEFPDDMDQLAIRREIVKAFPDLGQTSPSERPSIPEPGQVDQLRSPGITPPVPQAFPVEAQKQEQAAQFEARPIATPTATTQELLESGVRQEPPASEAEIQPIGEEGSVLRGVSSVVASVLNRPEYLAALLNPATAAAVAVRFTPPVVKQFTEDLGKASQGDNEAFGRALAVGLPIVIGGAKPAKQLVDKLALEVERGRPTPVIDQLAIEALTPRTERRTDAIPQRSPEEVPVRQPPQARQEVGQEVRDEGAPEVQKETVAPIEVFHGSPNKIVGDLKVSKADDFPLLGVSVTTDRAVAERYAQDVDLRKGGAISPTVFSGQFRGRVVDVSDLRKMWEETGRPWNDELTRQITDFAASKKYDAIDLASAGMGEPGELFVINPKSIETAPKIEGIGSAVPSEFIPTHQTPTGIKNATVERERATRGLPPAIEPARRGFGQVWDEAMVAIDRDPTIQDRLIAELREKPRSLTDREDAILLHRQIELQNEYGKATSELTKAFDEGRMADAEAQKSVVADLSNRLLDLYNIDKAAGTETGRGLAARKMMANEDFTLARMETEMRVAKNGKPLTDAERADITAKASEFERLNRELEAKLAQRDAELSQAKMAAATAEMKAAAASDVPSHIQTLVQRIGTTLDSRANAARKRLEGKLFSISPDVLKDLAEIGASNIYHIGLDFAKWSAKMVQDIGEHVRPHLQTVWDASRKLMDDVTDSVSDATSRAGVRMAIAAPKTPQERAEKVLGTIRDKDFHTKTKTEIKLDEEAFRLRFKLDEARKSWHRALMEKRIAEESTPQRIFRGGTETVNLSRAMLTSMDFSAVLRQGGFITAAHPIRSAKAIPDMLRAFRSKEQAFKVDEQILNRPNYPLYRRAGLFLSEHGVPLHRMEEAYMSRWAEKVPLVAGSARAYTTFLNKLRADSFDAMVESLGRKGQVTPAEAHLIANYINVATGRGAIGLRDNVAVGLNTIFFAPRYVASRFQTLLVQPLYHGILSGKVGITEGAAARKLVAQEYARVLIGAGIVYALADAAGFSIGTNPTSSDFGKIILGDTRVDPLAGLSQVTVLLSRLGKGETTTLKGKTVPIRGEGVPYGGQDATDVMKQFLRSKLAPVPGTLVDVAQGKNIIGEPVTAESVATRMLVPISMQDILDTMEEQGIPRGTALALLSMFGVGVQTYGPR